MVEDNAHGLGAYLEGQPLGTFGVLGTQSFHDTKNITSGEGGALLVNDLSWRRAEILREKGTNRSRFLRGEVDKYTWTDLGSSYLPSVASAAVLLAQMEGFEHIQERRQRVWETYARELAGWADRVRVRLMEEPPAASSPRICSGSCCRRRGPVGVHRPLASSGRGGRFPLPGPGQLARRPPPRACAAAVSR